MRRIGNIYDVTNFLALPYTLYRFPCSAHVQELVFVMFLLSFSKLIPTFCSVLVK